MNVILYLAMTANGLIAKEEDDTSWVSKVEWKSFSGIIKSKQMPESSVPSDLSQPIQNLMGIGGV